MRIKGRLLALGVLSTLVFLSCSESTDQKGDWNNIPSHFFEVGDSLKLHYKTLGTGDPIVFLHGNFTHSYLWRNIMPTLAQYGTCYAIDLMGMGKSDKPLIDYTIREQAKYLKVFMDSMKFNNSVLIGHEWGGGLAVHYGSNAAHLIKGYVLIEPIFSGADSAQIANHPNPLVKAYRNLYYHKNRTFRVFNENALLKEILPLTVLNPMTEATLRTYHEPFTELHHYRPLNSLFVAFPINGKPQTSMTFIGTSKGSFYSGKFKKLLIHSNNGIYVSPNGVDILKKNTQNFTTANVGEAGLLIPEDQPEATTTAICKWLENELGILPH